MTAVTRIAFGVAAVVLCALAWFVITVAEKDETAAREAALLKRYLPVPHGLDALAARGFIYSDELQTLKGLCRRRGYFTKVEVRFAVCEELASTTLVEISASGDDPKLLLVFYFDNFHCIGLVQEPWSEKP